ncbi:MAG: hypothetical protein R8N50_02795 [Alphaproteobacteria bacterium]|nr:hypothetical protein [Alphaproteobacteria bacterium]
MNTDTITLLLTNSGFHNVRVDPDFVYMEDPSCILRSFEAFVQYAWFAVLILTGLLLTGWAISMIRGAKNDLLVNMRNLVIIFGVLSISKPTMNIIYGDDLFARGCKTISVPMAEMNRLLAARNASLNSHGNNEAYETMNIYDSGATTSDIRPYSVAPLTSAGNPAALDL